MCTQVNVRIVGMGTVVSMQVWTKSYALKKYFFIGVDRCKNC